MNSCSKSYAQSCACRILACRQPLKSGAYAQDNSHDVGYGDAASFTKAFKRWAGVTPGRYREGGGW